MNAVFYRSLEYGEGGSDTAVALVAGFDGRISHFEQAATDLVAAKHDVIAYEYDNRVLLDGDPALLPQLIQDLSRDFRARTQDYGSRRYAGASLGGGIAWNMQKDAEVVSRGLYAAVGTDVAKLVMQNYIFRGVVWAVHRVDPRRAFVNNGYATEDLQEAWRSIQAAPITPFTVAYGSLDYIVRQREVGPLIEEWKTHNDVRVVNRRRGHSGIIKWFSANIPTMLSI